MGNRDLRNGEGCMSDQHGVGCMSDQRRGYPDLSGFSGAAGIRPAIYRGFTDPLDSRRYSSSAAAPCLAAEGGKARSGR